MKNGLETRKYQTKHFKNGAGCRGVQRDGERMICLGEWEPLEQDDPSCSLRIFRERPHLGGVYLESGRGSALPSTHGVCQK